MKAYEYGIFFSDKKEKVFIDSINQVLLDIFSSRAGRYKLSKNKNSSILKYRLPFEYNYLYNTLMKPEGLFIEIYPNYDINGKRKFNIDGISWNIFINSLGFYINESLQVVNNDNPKMDTIIESLLKTIPYNIVLLHEYRDGEERL